MRPLIESSALRLLASAYGTRLPEFPDTPTIAELGFPGFNLSAWLGVVVPAGTPKARVKRLSTELVTIVQTPDVMQKYATLSALPRVMGAEDCEARFGSTCENLASSKCFLLHPQIVIFWLATRGRSIQSGQHTIELVRSR
jgi:tripartite-type tricarboxylate transporter receptor subunit TctC